MVPRYTGSFDPVPHSTLSDLCNPEFDPTTRTVRALAAGGSAGHVYCKRLFRWANESELILIRQEDQEELDTARYERTVRKLEPGDHFLREVRALRNGQLEGKLESLPYSA